MAKSQIIVGDRTYNLKDSTARENLVPSDGYINQVLTKTSSSTYGWTDFPAPKVPTGGTANQILVKNSSTDYDVSWVTPSTQEQQVYPNTNLLDNWYFGNPINQRGSTVYTTSSARIHSIDRWDCYSDCSCTVQNGYITITDTSETNLGYFGQFIEWDITKALLGNKITASILLNDGSLFTSSVEVPSSIPSATTNILAFGNGSGDLSPWTVILSLSKSSNTYGMCFWIRTNFSYANILAVKLEIGSTQTLAYSLNNIYVLKDIPNYTNEFMKCCRYFFSPGDYCLAPGTVSSDAKQYIMAVNIPVPMRTTPIASATGWNGRLYTGYTIHSGNAYIPFENIGIWNYNIKSCTINVKDVVETAVDTNNTVILFDIKGLTLSADI